MFKNLIGDGAVFLDTRNQKDSVSIYRRNNFIRLSVDHDGSGDSEGVVLFVDLDHEQVKQVIKLLQELVK